MKIMHGMDVAPDIEMPEGFELGDGVRRDIRCVEEWPGCADGEYDPRCCRFPKSCSATSVPNRVYRSGILEPVLMNKETAVTRSVEIPEAARAAGLLALHADPEWHRSDGTGVWRANYQRAVDLILEAALPYLAPAEPAKCHRCGYELRPDDTYTRLDGTTYHLRSCPDRSPAPAVPQPVDREALEQLFETHGVFETTFISTERMESSRRILADAVLALLAGEQEQVESPE